MNPTGPNGKITLSSIERLNEKISSLEGKHPPSNTWERMLSMLISTDGQKSIAYLIIIFLLIIGVGLVATPYTEGLRLIPFVHSQGEGTVGILNRILILQKAQCLNAAETKDEYDRCAWDERTLITSPTSL